MHEEEYDPKVEGRTDKSAGSETPSRAEPGGAPAGARRSATVVIMAIIAAIVLLVVFGLVTDIF